MSIPINCSSPFLVDNVPIKFMILVQLSSSYPFITYKQFITFIQEKIYV
ncbi:hypothetical protein PRO82_002171 [Candidatus Protochlamydia amoebophila]|nr:hypothetical protein [Candidatus Protochlamydia amoebophila]